MKKLTTVLLAILISAFVLPGCSNIDVVAKYARQSFDGTAQAFPQILSLDDSFYVLSVDGQTRLEINRDYAASGEDIRIATPIQPFLDAGLDPAKLGGNYRADDMALYIAGDFGSGGGQAASANEALFESVAYDRKTLSYHQELDHYGIGLAAGKFEFAKDYLTNDKDVVFVLYAAPLAELGVNVQNIDGWIFKTMKDEAGNDLDVLLKPYDLQ